MRSDLFYALSLSALLVACAHDKTHRSAHDSQSSEARAEAAHAERHARADRDRDGVDRDGDGRDQDGVELPKRNDHGRDRVATAGDELPAPRDADNKGRDRDRDNTAVNERDRGGTQLTPLDQGNSEIDIDLTQRIRKAVMDDDALSFKAKNVKIITRDGHVTLRGTVKTPEEKAAIGKTAIGAAGAAHVTNQLEIAE